MGTSEDIRADQDQQQRQYLHARYPHDQQQQPHTFSPVAGPQPFGSPSLAAAPGVCQWPHEKLSESDLANAAHAMEVDPTHDANTNNQQVGRKSPSPTNYADETNVFHFGESPNANNQQQGFAGGIVATPITRFLTKQTFGFIPKPSFPSPSDGVVLPPRAAPSSPALNASGNGKIPSLRLPSLSGPGSNGSLPQSPLASPQGSFSLPVGETLSRLFGSASLHNGSAPGTPTGCASPQLQRTSSFTLPPLKRACLSPTTTLPPLAQQLSLDDIGKPFRYQRSMSCPSDAMARVARALQEQVYEHETERDAYAAPRVVLQHSDIPKLRAERSNSVDASTVLAMRDAHHRALYGGGEPTLSHDSTADFHHWLDRSDTNRHPLASLAESAQAMQRLSTSQESPRSISSVHDNGSDEDEATNPFDVSDSSDMRREKKLCAFPRCASNAVTRGLCISHGGGRRCQRKGCTRGAQSKGLCVAHGGGRICKAKGCSNIQRSMGLCIRHGGGKRCSVQGCQKGVVRQDLCTAHGGKRKCKVEDCNKHVKKKGLCRSHANAVLGSAAPASAMSSPRSEAFSPEYSS